MAFFETSKRKSSIHSGRIGIPSRTVHRTSGQAIPIDSISSLDGLPISLEGRGEVKGEIRNRGKIMKFISSHALVIVWVSTLLSIGAYFQGWL